MTMESHSETDCAQELVLYPLCMVKASELSITEN